VVVKESLVLGFGGVKVFVDFDVAPLLESCEISAQSSSMGKSEEGIYLDWSSGKFGPHSGLRNCAGQQSGV
jgi:hypothetical protein